MNTNELRAFVQEIIRESSSKGALDDDLIEIVNAWVNDPRNLDDRGRYFLQKFVAAQRIGRPKRIERIVRDYPDLKPGNGVDFDLVSFSFARFTEDEKAGHIAWKTSDRGIFVIERADEGCWPIDYSVVDVSFSAGAEREVIVTGRYRVERVEKIVEPGTYEPYGYRVPAVYLVKS